MNGLPEAELHGKSVLVIEDDSAVREAFHDFLALYGLAVELAADAGEAVRQMRRRRFDVIISDVAMPGNGHTVAEYLEVHQPSTPLVVITAFDCDGELLRRAAFAYLIKPVFPDRLIRVLGDAIASAR